MPEIIRVAATVGTPIALLALMAAFGYFAYTRRLKFLENTIKALPPEERALRTDEYLTRYGIDGRNLELPDKVALITRELTQRHQRSSLYVIVLAAVFVLCFAMAALGYIFRPSQSGTGQTDDTGPKLISLALQEQLSKCRDMLSQPPREDWQRRSGFPDLSDSVMYAKWNEPRKSSITQIVILADTDPKLVARTLISLLGDSDGVVAVGSLIALRDILKTHPKDAKILKTMLPKGYDQPLNLREAFIKDEDFTVFSGTELFYNGHFEGAVLDGVRFDGLSLRLAGFAGATVLNCSFGDANLDSSEWQNSAVRETNFERANMSGVFAERSDFGRGSADSSILFAPNNFHLTILTGAVLIDADFAGARLHGARLTGAKVSGADFRGALVDGDNSVTADSMHLAGAISIDQRTKFDDSQ